MVLLMWRTIRLRRRRRWPYSSSSQPPTNSPPFRGWQGASCHQIVVIDDLNPEDSHPSVTRPPLHGYRSTGSDVPCSWSPTSRAASEPAYILAAAAPTAIGHHAASAGVSGGHSNQRNHIEVLKYVLNITICTLFKVYREHIYSIKYNLAYLAHLFNKLLFTFLKFYKVIYINLPFITFNNHFSIF